MLISEVGREHRVRMSCGVSKAQCLLRQIAEKFKSQTAATFESKGL